MSTFAISIQFTCTVKDYDKAGELAERIGNYVQAEKMATDYSLIDIEQLDDDEPLEELDFEEDDE